MQTGGIGINHRHTSHHITACMHDHGTKSEKEAGAGAKSAGASAVDGQVISREQEGRLSLAAWLDKTAAGGRKLLKRIWGETAAEVSSDAKDAGSNQLNPAVITVSEQTAGKSSTAPGGETAAETIAVRQAAAASTLVQLLNQPTVYFAAIEDKGEKQRHAWEKIRIRFHKVMGNLSRQFFRQETFQPRQGEKREDLRKHSRYREQDKEIDCVLTDDSYLLDSYDRKGEYSKITTKSSGVYKET